MSSLSSSTQFSVETFNVNDESNKLSPTRKLALLIIICRGCVEFEQILNSWTPSFFSAIAIISGSLGKFAESQSVWITSALLLTYASSLLISGRVTDVYGPKMVFIGGTTALGVISLCGGFPDNKILMILLRALSGMASAMTVPASSTLLVNIFSDSLPQARALSMFTGFGVLASTLALFIGAVLVDSASYHWVFWFAAIVAAPVAIIPPQMAGTANSTSLASSSPATAKWKKLDIVAVYIITVALTVFVFAIISSSWWLSAFQWSVLLSAVHMIPIGVIAFAVNFSGGLARIFNPKWIIPSGLTLCMVITALLVVSGAELDDYWLFVFSAFVVGTSGMMLLVVSHANIAMFQAVPSSSMMSIVGGALQFGSAIGLAAMNAVEVEETSSSSSPSSSSSFVEVTRGCSDEYNNNGASFWFLFVFVLVAVEFIISMGIFYNWGADYKRQLQRGPDQVYDLELRDDKAWMLELCTL